MITSDLFEQIISKENLYLAAHRAALGKRFRENIALWRLNMETQVGRLHDDLKAGRYKHGRYRIFQIYDPKKRDISVAPFRDRVVHHAVHDVIEPTIDKRFIHDSYACRNGKGTHIALDRAHSFLKANQYCFHGDIRKYFPSIDHALMKEFLRRHITDEKVLVLMDGIIDSNGTKGLPIGNLTSQFFANLYLHELDFFVKHELHCSYYLRYMDDFLIFENDHSRLESMRMSIDVFLKDQLKLELHISKSQIFKTAQGIKFLGFRLYPKRRRIATQGVRRFRQRLKKFRYSLANGLMEENKVAESILCWKAHSTYANAARLRQSLSQETDLWNKDLAKVFLT
jgi:RNA-directed DNA polymerase